MNPANVNNGADEVNCVEDRYEAGVWHVETIEVSKTKDGRVFQATFRGPEAEARARAYHAMLTDQPPPPATTEGGELREAVARAIYRATLTPRERQLRSVSRTEQDYEDLLWKHYTSAADAVLALVTARHAEERARLVEGLKTIKLRAHQQSLLMNVSAEVHHQAFVELERRAARALAEGRG
jgi:hypothetical protein